MKASKASLIDAIVKLHEKYVSLVWYARKRPEDYAIEGVAKAASEVEFLYPDDIKALRGEDGDWSHGFNSGVLAGIRYVLTSYDISIEQANEWFPELDS